jgi:sec-independent protein translocase protein TatC
MTDKKDDAFPHSEQEFDPVDNFRMPLLEHLRELRKRFIVSAVAVFIGIGITFWYVDPIWDFLLEPITEAMGNEGTMAITEPLEGFLTYLKIAAISGFALASPVVFYQFWKFVAPGLYPKEQKRLMPLVVASTLLFLLGAAFAYFVIFDLAFQFLLEYIPDETLPVLSINSYLSIVARLLLAFGLSFQLPIIVYFLARIGLIDHRDMMYFFKYAVVAIFVLASFLTPPDMVSQVLMAIPLTILYGLGIIVARIFSTKVRDEEEAP